MGKNYQLQQVSRISEASTVPPQVWRLKQFQFFTSYASSSGFLFKKTEISRFASGKNQSPKTTMPFWFIHSHTQPAPLIWKEWMGFTTFILHLSLHLPTRWGVFFRPIPSKLTVFPNRLRFANIYCSLFQGVIWWFFHGVYPSPIKSLDLGWLRSLIINYWPSIWVFPKIGVPQNGWFIMEHPIKMDDLGVPIFSETSIFSQICSLQLPSCMDWVHSHVKPWFWMRFKTSNFFYSNPLQGLIEFYSFGFGSGHIPSSRLLEGILEKTPLQNHLPNLQITDTLGSVVPWPNWSPNKKCWKWWVSEICGSFGLKQKNNIDIFKKGIPY